jgi:hypothetical protein
MKTRIITRNTIYQGCIFYITMSEEKMILVRNKIKHIFSTSLLNFLDNIDESQKKLYLWTTLYTNQTFANLMAEEIDKGIINYMIKKRCNTFDVNIYINKARMLKLNLIPKFST